TITCSKGPRTALSVSGNLSGNAGAAERRPLPEGRERKNENGEWSDGPCARAAIFGRSNLDVRGQDICLRFERAGRQYRCLRDGYDHRRAHGDWQGRGRQAGHAMAVSPNKKHLYAVVRSQPTRVLTYAIDPATGALSQKASAPLPDSMPYVSTDQTGRFLFTASYGGDKLAVSPISETAW